MTKTRFFVPDADCLIRSQIYKDYKKPLLFKEIIWSIFYLIVIGMHYMNKFGINFVRTSFLVLILTSAISLSAVSAPRLKSVPGTLLLIVAGIMVMGMQNSGYLSRFSCKIKALLNDYKTREKQMA